VTALSRSPLKLLHTADVHLDIDGYGASQHPRDHRAITHQAFSTVIDVAIREDVDLLIIAGDLFDSNRPGRDAIDFAIHEIRRAGRPVVMIPGNHDCLSSESVYRQVNLPSACPNLLFITHPTGELHHLPEHNLVLWGRGMVEHEPAYHPLAGLPPRQSAAWHLALGHGFFMEDDVASYRSSPIYASEIRASGWDYIALGHCHAFADVSQARVKAFFSGAPGFFPGAQGNDGYVALIECEPGLERRIDVTRVNLRPLVLAALDQHG
jgi:DNA repair protein SbcD/Mre11